MEQHKKAMEAAQAKSQSKGKSESKRVAVMGRKRSRIESDDELEDEGVSPKRKKGDNGEVQPQLNEEEAAPVFQQPSLVTGARLKKYQLEGLQWMVSLDQNGISGILGASLEYQTLSTFLIKAFSSRRNGARKGDFLQQLW